MQISIFQPQVIRELGRRSNQEDSIFPEEGKATVADRVFVLCDGMGGHESGEVASQLVCEVLSQGIIGHWDGSVLTDETIREAFSEVKERIDESDTSSFSKMGTTMVLLCLHGNGATMAHIGDSRIYHIRPSERRILYKSRDHSVAYDMYIAGRIGKEELGSYKRNLITRAIMPGQGGQYDVDITHTTDVMSGDYFILCSDGMLEQMSDSELVDTFCTYTVNEQIRDRLVCMTRENEDNHTMFFIQIESVLPESSDHSAPNEEKVSYNNAILWEERHIQRINQIEHPKIINGTCTSTFPFNRSWRKFFL